MKRFLMFGLAAIATATALVSCGEDEVPITADPEFAFKANEVYTYDYWDRDTNDTRVDSTKRKRTWTVLEVNAAGRAGVPTGHTPVTMIEDVIYETDGNTVQSRDTIYISSKSSGEVFQYDMMGTVAARFESELLDSALSQIPKLWTQVGDFKSASSYTFTEPSTPNFTQPIQIDFNGTLISGSISGSSTGYHQGKVDFGDYTDAYGTDHTVFITAAITGLSQPVVEDSVMISYIVDLEDGIIQHSMDSKIVPVTLPTGPLTAPVLGFDMELVSVVRPE